MMTAEVRSSVNAPVENIEITTAQTRAGQQRASQPMGAFGGVRSACAVMRSGALTYSSR